LPHARSRSAAGHNAESRRCLAGYSAKVPDFAAGAFHRAALEVGGKDNGKPGLRADYGPNYYAAFAVDPDGYRIEAWCGKAA
jgi:hypothetical protein